MNSEQINVGLRTVAHIATYIDELKLQAHRLADAIPPQQRGYFTPEEENATRALLISYWQSRCALLDVVTTFRNDRSVDKRERPAAFLVAFAAAIVLVDAARFIRETVHENSVVRSKLNEPAEEFGIPAGVYDQIQQSLVSTRNAWRLYFAVKYFEDHESELRTLAENADLAPMMAIIDRLIDRLDVSISQFAQAKMRTRGGQLLRKITHDILGQALYGIQKFGSTLIADQYAKPGHRPQLPKTVMQQLDTFLEPGDILMVRKEYALTNYFLPGYWPHAALYLGNAEDLTELGIHNHKNVQPRWATLTATNQGRSQKVLEAMKDGVHIRSVETPFSSDSIVILRQKLTRAEFSFGLARGIAHEGKCYDFDFDFRSSERLVCTEVIYRAFEGVGNAHFDLTTRVGRPTLSGSDLIQFALAGKNLTAVAAFDRNYSEDLVTSTEAPQLISSCLGLKSN